MCYCFRSWQCHRLGRFRKLAYCWVRHCCRVVDSAMLEWVLGWFRRHLTRLIVVEVPGDVTLPDLACSEISRSRRKHSLADFPGEITIFGIAGRLLLARGEKQPIAARHCSVVIMTLAEVSLLLWAGRATKKKLKREVVSFS